MASTTFKIRNAPGDAGNLEKFLSTINRYGSGLAQSCRYLVVMSPIKQMYNPYFPTSSILSDLPYLCEQAELPGKTLVVNDARYYGPNFKYPVQTEYSDITLTFIVRDEMLEKEFFDNWMMSINPTDSYDFSYKSDYVSQIDIIQYSVLPTAAPTHASPNAIKSTPTYKITLRDAFPTSIAPMGLVWGEEGFHRVAVTFAFTEYSRVTDVRRQAYALVQASDGAPATLVTGSILGDFVTPSVSQTIPRDKVDRR